MHTPLSVKLSEFKAMVAAFCLVFFMKRSIIFIFGAKFNFSAQTANRTCLNTNALLCFFFLQQHEYTFLMYLNPDWNENMYGETIFLNQIRDPEYSENGTMVVDKEYEMFGKIYSFNDI